MTADEQLELWVLGESRCPNDRDECCPDFSCCMPKLLADKKVREAFANADDEARAAMLGMFLGAAVSEAAPGKVILIIDDTSPTEH